MPNKTVTFGEVITYPDKPSKDAKKADAEKAAIKNRFNCGSLRNSLKIMAGGNGQHLIAIRLVRSKLRKREDNLHTSAPTVTTNHNNNVIQTPPAPPPAAPEVIVCPSHRGAEDSESTESLPPPFLWLISTTTTAASSQFTLYNNDEEWLLTSTTVTRHLTDSVVFQDTLVHNLAGEEPPKQGFRKNLSGKWRRLVKKKQPPSQEVYTIPAELKDQLKTIYVY